MVNKVNSKQTAWKLLHIEPTNNKKKIKKAYQKQMLKYHPDKCIHKLKWSAKKCQKYATAMNKAYDLAIKHPNSVNTLPSAYSLSTPLSSASQKSYKKKTKFKHSRSASKSSTKKRNKQMKYSQSSTSSKSLPHSNKKSKKNESFANKYDKAKKYTAKNKVRISTSIGIITAAAIAIGTLWLL